MCRKLVLFWGSYNTDSQHAQWLLEIGAGSTMDDNEMIQVS